MWKFAKLGEIPEFAVDDPETLFAFWRHRKSFYSKLEKYEHIHRK